MSVVAIIPARKGSIRLRNKNRKILGGVPLINWSINTAKKLKFVDDIIITTDDKKILNNLKKNKFVKTLFRPGRLAKNDTEMIDVIFHTIKFYEKKFNKISTVLLLQPTSPIRSLKIIGFGYNKYQILNKKKSVISVSVSSNPLKKFFKIEKKNLRLYKGEKKIKNLFQINGNFYFSSVDFIKKYKSFFFDGKTYPVIIKSKKISMDIDTVEDFQKVERYLKKQ